MRFTIVQIFTLLAIGVTATPVPASPGQRMQKDGYDSADETLDFKASKFSKAHQTMRQDPKIRKLDKEYEAAQREAGVKDTRRVSDIAAPPRTWPHLRESDSGYGSD
ncbi:uncharacterized protein PgNI_00141 [Pyricularia grisea]|uniref:Uncharacterized protein n=1 Tax=Pyricularia grisea TaxID=148305 RepID=A0A6P8BF77_PYRGI|nr:uncharacterized protein PgNI_00141 [Pyricularia grisea]TLD15476.1 hypothetical protein PgNI_00141 [Pyricularia grisea]